MSAIITYNRTWVRVLALVCFVFFILFWGCTFYAQAVASLVIGGVAVASAALLASILIVAYGDTEYGQAMKDAAAAAGQPLQTWMEGRMNAYIAVQSQLPGALASTPAGFIYALCKSLTYNSDGTLIYGRELADFVYNFANWLSDNGDISIPGSEGEAITAPEDIATAFSTLTSYSVYAASSITATRNNDVVNSVVVTGSNVNFGFLVNSRVYNDGYIWVACSLNPFSFTNSWNTGSSVSSSKVTINGKTFYVSHSYYYSVGKNNWQTSINPSTLTFSSYPGSNEFTDCWAYITLFGKSTGASDGLDVWNDDTATDGLVLDPTGLLGDLWDTLAGSIANVGDYIQALADVIAGIANPAIPIVGLGDIAIPVVPDLTIPIAPAIPQDIAEDTGVVEESDTPFVGTGDYTLPLADFFPFCIPFDLYKMLNLLSASPVAPSFDYAFPLPSAVGGGTFTISIDLSPFDTVAQVLRAMELIAFCVGLGYATKKLLFGS